MMKFGSIGLRRLIVLSAVVVGLLGLLFSKLALKFVHAEPNQIVSGTVGQRHILVDQFGYLPEALKVAVIREPVEGYDKDRKFEPGKRFGVRRVGTNEIVFEKSIESWNGGRVQPSSGDRGWWFDFSSVRTPGKYQVVDLDHDVSSSPFEVGDGVYKDVLRAAVRTYYYQRSGFAKTRPYADICWEDDPAYLGVNQDKEVRDITDPDNMAKLRDLRGGWFDAGDTNKYVTFAAPVIHQLLAAYEETPSVFSDDFGIPESGNGIPDIIDEVRWEIDWLRRMQFPAGGFALKVGATKYVPGGAPSRDSTPRFYIPECTSATISGAGALAHAALVFRRFPALADESSRMESEAVRAWQRFNAQGSLQEHCDTGRVLSGNADLNSADQKGRAVEAAVYLWALTNQAEYQTYIAGHFRETRPYRDIGWSRYSEDEGHALLWLTSLGATPDTLKRQILSDFSREARDGSRGVFGFDASSDLYRAFLHDPQYHWGSNQPRANYGNANLDAIRYSENGSQAGTSYRERAAGILHYFHGVNPFGIVMLSNMDAIGATRSLNEIYHVWYWPGTAWSNAKTSKCGPAPGYIAGGPNGNVANDGVPKTMVPPVGQPLQKSFAVSNNPKDMPWSFSEPGIYYQSAYIKLLSGLMRPPTK